MTIKLYKENFPIRDSYQQESLKKLDSLIETAAKSGLAEDKYHLGVELLALSKTLSLAGTPVQLFTEKQGFNLIKEAVEDGYHDGLNKLGYMYGMGHGTDKDLISAKNCFEKAVENGFLDAADSVRAIKKDIAQQIQTLQNAL